MLRRATLQHPAIVGGVAPQIHGVGAGILYSLAELAGLLGVPLVWGEATAFSAPFYAKTCRLPRVQDHFFIRAKNLRFFRQQFRNKSFGEA